jgi:hypothetical protein
MHTLLRRPLQICDGELREREGRNEHIPCAHLGTTKHLLDVILSTVSIKYIRRDNVLTQSMSFMTSMGLLPVVPAVVPPYIAALGLVASLAIFCPAHGTEPLAVIVVAKSP